MLCLSAISYGDLSSLLPFGQTIDIFELSGGHLLEAFEYSMNKTSNRNKFVASYMLQVSGKIKVKIFSRWALFDK